MFNYLIKIEYDGSKFVGWQFQKNGRSVQSEIERALKKIFKIKLKICGAGRTDKGVHASGQHANFIVENEIKDKKIFLNSINFFLIKKSISIIDLKKKNLNFHARFSAKERVYKYLIINRYGSLVLDKDKAWHIRKKIDLNLLKKGGKIFEGIHDFSTYRSSSCTAKSPIKKMNLVNIQRRGEKIFLIFKSKSFLQNQIRSMVGCLYQLSSKKWTLKKFKKVFKLKKRSLCAPPAPACGLYLENIKY